MLSPADSTIWPPAPEVPVPTVIETAPPRQPVATPDPMYSAPVLPPLDVPDEKTSLPLEPESPEFAVRMVIAPLDVDVPSPVAMARAPPVRDTDRPVAMLMPPPTPLVPLPTVMDTSPPRPAVAAPVPTRMDPLLPPFAVPNEKISMPLTPAAPEFAVRMVITPLEDVVPSPVAMPKAPPVCTRPRPVAMLMPADPARAAAHRETPAHSCPAQNVFISPGVQIRQPRESRGISSLP